MSKMNSIKNELVEMWELVHSQLKKSYKALVHFDKDLAREVILLEERVNSSEVLINTDCENYFAMQSHYPVNIQYILGILKVSIQLERVGDAAEQIANCIVETDEAFCKDLLASTKTIDLFKKTINISGYGLDSFEEESNLFNLTIEQKRQEFSLLVKDANHSIVTLIQKGTENMNQLLTLFSITKDLERIGEQILLIPNSIFQDQLRVA
jgi:Phosphate uptake regulator